MYDYYFENKKDNDYKVDYFEDKKNDKCKKDDYKDKKDDKCKKDDYEDKKDDKCNKYDYEDKKEDQCKIDCKDVLKKYHKLIAEANDLYNASDNIVDKEVAGAICDALKALTKSFMLNEKANNIEDKADYFLDKSGCDKKSNKCKEELCRANKAFDKENEYLYKAGDLLKDALEAIQKSVKFRKMGNDYIDAYVKCIHRKHEKKDDYCPKQMDKYYK